MMGSLLAFGMALQMAAWTVGQRVEEWDGSSVSMMVVTDCKKAELTAAMSVKLKVTKKVQKDEMMVEYLDFQTAV